MNADSAQLVPAYAYDQHMTNVVYIRDKELHGSNPHRQKGQENYDIMGIYRFPSLKGTSHPHPITLSRFSTFSLNM